MIRVGFAPRLYGEGWIGGLSYFRNLFSALHDLERRDIEPVLLVRGSDEKTVHLLKSYVSTMAVPDLLNPMSDRWHAKALHRMRPLSRALWGRFLVSREIEILSHSDPLVPDGMLPSLGFIYDFQHKRLPELFSPAENAERDRAFLSLCRHSSAVLVSSGDALADLATFFPQYGSKGRVLRFVANVAESPATTREALQSRYQLPDVFIYLPNQFWKHKNHLTVLEALSILKQRRKKNVVVVATGAATDYRHPEYFARIMEAVTDLGLRDSFRYLGVVSREDVLGLIRASAAVLNPSLFEGWSTSVEEAKSFGKLVILSSIPVHREQAPERGLFFETTSTEQLADHLETAMASYATEAEERWMRQARAALPGRVREYAAAYQSLVHEQLAARRR